MAGCGCGGNNLQARRPTRGIIQSPARVGTGVLNAVGDINNTHAAPVDPVLEERRVKEKQRRDDLLKALGRPS